jgi:hypothetical protein
MARLLVVRSESCRFLCSTLNPFAGHVDVASLIWHALAAGSLIHDLQVDALRDAN